VLLSPRSQQSFALFDRFATAGSASALVDKSGADSLEFCALWRRNNPEVDVNFARFPAQWIENSRAIARTAARKIRLNFARWQNHWEGIVQGLKSTHSRLYPTTGRFMAFAFLTS
jgi:hypothetical protein